MKCCGSQITFTAPEPPAARDATREAAAQFAAELTRVAFAPLARALGFYGDAALAAASQSIARRETGGLTDEIERIVVRAR